MKHILLTLAQKNKKSIALILLLILVSTAIQGVFPYFTKIIVDNVLIDKEYSFIYIISGFILMAVLVGGMTDFLKNVYMTQLAENTLVSIKRKVLLKLRSKNYEFYLKRNSGELLSLFQSDLVHLEHMIGWTLPSAFQTVIQICISCTFLIFLNVKLFLICVIVVPIPFLIAKLFSKSIKTKTNVIQSNIGLISAQLNESLRGTKELSLYSKYEWDTKKNVNAFHRLPGPKVEVAKLRALSNNIYFVFHWCIYVMVFMIGTNLVAHNQVSIGTIIAFSTYIISLFSPLSHLSLIYVDLQSAIGGLNRIDNLFSEDDTNNFSEKVYLEEKEKPDLLLRMTNVGYKYETNDYETLSRVHLDIPKGVILGIEGVSGAGKSTLINVISGLIKPTYGLISYSTDAMPIVVVSQESFFFSMSIKENLTFGEEVDMDRIISTCKMVSIHNEIQALPNGYETVMSESGNLFSGGQKQRIAIARALLQRASLLILDEATSALDKETEKRVISNIFETVKQQRGAILLVSHTPAVMDRAEVRVELKEGTITNSAESQKAIFPKEVMEVANR
jgi:ABC-type bacteriocin/lantibiotic exporter with double-glycine peptidase domain